MHLTDAEFEVMRILWSGAEMKPAEILEQFPRDISDSTLRTFLSDLLDEGYVTRRKKGKAYYYRAKMRQESAFRQRLLQLVDAFCEGSHGVLVKTVGRIQEAFRRRPGNAEGASLKTRGLTTCRSVAHDSALL